jgi:hypothetical protein
MTEPNRSPETEPEPGTGQYLALGVGVACLLGAAWAVFSGAGPVVATVLALIGASALAGWMRARRSGRRP